MLFSVAETVFRKCVCAPPKPRGKQTGKQPKSLCVVLDTEMDIRTPPPEERDEDIVVIDQIYPDVLMSNVEQLTPRNDIRSGIYNNKVNPIFNRLDYREPPMEDEREIDIVLAQMGEPIPNTPTMYAASAASCDSSDSF